MVKIDIEEVTALLTDRQRELIEGVAEETGFPRGAWTACASLRLHAKVFAAINLAKAIQAERPRWSWLRCLDEAEARVLTDEAGDALITRPKSIRSTIGRWRQAVQSG